MKKIIVSVMISCLTLSSCAPENAQSDFQSQVSSSSSMVNQELYADFSWLILNQGDNFEISIPQIDAKQNRPIAQMINDEIKQIYHQEAKDVMSGVLNTSSGGYQIKTYAHQVGDYLNLTIVQSGTDSHTDGKVYCVSYNRVTDQRHTLDQALTEDKITETAVQSMVIDSYLKNNPDIIHEDMTSIDFVGVMTEQGANEYIYYLSVLGSDGLEYQHVLGYVLETAILKTFSDYTKSIYQFNP